VTNCSRDRPTELANRDDVEPEDEVQASTKRSSTRREPVGQHVEKPESKPFASSASTTPFASTWTRIKSVTQAGSVGRQRRAVPVLTVRVTRKRYVDRARRTTRPARLAKICVTRARESCSRRAISALDATSPPSSCLCHSSARASRAAGPRDTDPAFAESSRFRAVAKSTTMHVAKFLLVELLGSKISQAFGFGADQPATEVRTRSTCLRRSASVLGGRRPGQ